MARVLFLLGFLYDMAKETLYFTHDFGARNDPKMINLQIKHGMTGIGCYWCIVEMLHEEGGEIPLEYDRISFVLRIDTKVIESVINDFDLFLIQGKMLSSKSVLKRIDIRNNKSAKARESISSRWNKAGKNTNVSESDTNVQKNDTIKERKEIKESKGKESEEIISPHKLKYDRTEEQSLKTELENSDVWHEDVCRKLSNDKNIFLSPQQLKQKIPAYMLALAAKSKYPITLNEAKDYFSNWLPYEIEKKNSEQPQRRSLEKQSYL